MITVKCDVCGYKEEYRKDSMQFCRGDCLEKSGYHWLTMEGLPKPVFNIVERWHEEHCKKIKEFFKEEL